MDSKQIMIDAIKKYGRATLPQIHKAVHEVVGAPVEDFYNVLFRLVFDKVAQVECGHYSMVEQ